MPRVRFESQVSPERSYALFDAAWTYAKQIEFFQAVAPAKKETLAVVVNSNPQVCAPLLECEHYVGGFGMLVNVVQCLPKNLQNLSTQLAGQVEVAVLAASHGHRDTAFALKALHQPTR